MDGHFGSFSWPKLKVRAGRLKAGDPGSNAMKQGKQQQQSSDKCSSPPKNCEGCGFRRGFPLGTGTPHQKTNINKQKKTHPQISLCMAGICICHIFPLEKKKITKQQLNKQKQKRLLQPKEAFSTLKPSGALHSLGFFQVLALFFFFLNKRCTCALTYESRTMR